MKDEKRLRLSTVNLGAIKQLQRENSEWGCTSLNKLSNLLIADGIRVRMLAMGKMPKVTP